MQGKILAHKGAYFGATYSLTYVGLARASALSGDLALWKDADSGQPILAEVRKECAAIN